jgi:hypothetical protein
VFFSFVVCGGCGLQRGGVCQMSDSRWLCRHYPTESGKKKRKEKNYLFFLSMMKKKIIFFLSLSSSLCLTHKTPGFTSFFSHVAPQV